MIDLKAKWHGLPVPLVIVGGTLAGVVGYRFVKQYRAAKAASASGDATTVGSGNNNPLPGWDQLAGMIGPLGGSSPTGPLVGYDSFGVPVYGTPKPDGPKDTVPPADPVTATPAPVNATPAVTPAPASPAVAYIAPSTPVTPTPASPGPLPIMAVPSALVQPNPIPGESGQIVTTNNGLPAGAPPMTYGGNQQQLSDILSAVINPTPVVSPPAYVPPQPAVPASWNNQGSWADYSWSNPDLGGWNDPRYGW